MYHESVAEKVEEALAASGKTFFEILIGCKGPSHRKKEDLVTFNEISADNTIVSVPPVYVRIKDYDLLNKRRCICHIFFEIFNKKFKSHENHV